MFPARYYIDTLLRRRCVDLMKPFNDRISLVLKRLKKQRDFDDGFLKMSLLVLGE